MSWKRRLAELVVAGGMVSSSGCFSVDRSPIDASIPGCFGGPNALCNANPDPCCCALDMAACTAYRKPDLAVPPHD